MSLDEVGPLRVGPDLAARILLEAPRRIDVSEDDVCFSQVEISGNWLNVCYAGALSELPVYWSGGWMRGQSDKEIMEFELQRGAEEVLEMREGAYVIGGDFVVIDGQDHS